MFVYTVGDIIAITFGVIAIACFAITYLGHLVGEAKDRLVLWWRNRP